MDNLEQLSDEEVAARVRETLRQTRRKSFTNWALSFKVKPEAIYYPASDSQVQLLVEYARREGLELRAFGSGHSPSDLVCTKDLLVQLDAMNKVLQVDLEKRTMTVEAGIRLHQLIDAARSHGLALSCLGSIAEQSLAGAISTATHGAGTTHKVISGGITELWIVTSDAALLHCSSSENPDLFSASLCGLGCTGIIVRATIQLTSDYNLKDEHFSMTFEEFLDNADKIMSMTEYVRAYWVPQVARVKMSCLSRCPLDTPLKPIAASWYNRWIKDWLFFTHLHQIGLFCSRFIARNLIFPHARFQWHFAFSDTLHPYRSLLYKLPNQPHPDFPNSDNYAHFVDRYEKLFTYDCGPRQYTFECAVPLDRLKENLQALEEWLRTEASDRNGLRHHFPIELRPAEKDDIWLSPAYGRRVVYIGVCQYKPYGYDVPWQEFFSKFEDICIAHGGRPHWAKSHHCSPYQLQRLYPKFEDFIKVRDRVDPRGVFLNPYTKRHLLGQIGTPYDFTRFMTSVDK